MQENLQNSADSSNHFSDAFQKIFKQVVAAEAQLDALRELLNEQIQFNLKDFYVIVAGTSQSINCKHISKFVKDGLEAKQNFTQQSIESFIKYYNGSSSLSLSFTQFSSVFLNRQNRLLTKMTLERESIGTLPNYILNYAKKILIIELKLHHKLDQFQRNWTQQSSIFVQNIVNNRQGYFQKQKLLDFLSQLSNRCPKSIQVQIESFQAYLKPFGKQDIQRQDLENLLCFTNCNAIAQYLKDQQKYNYKLNPIRRKIQKNLMNGTFNDPFVRPQFHDCLFRPKVTDMFSYREIKSIEKHMDRLGKIDRKQISDKMKKYETVIEKHSQKCLEAIRDIIWLQKQIEYARVQLSICPDFYPVLFFECFHKDKQGRIIPSALDIYLKQFGINIPLNEIYLLFKRYAWHLEGKMDFNSFCSMFDVCQVQYSRVQKNRQIKSLTDVDVQTKKSFLLLLATIIKKQKSIQSIKNNLSKVKQLNLRDVFACFDTDQDGYLSMTDFRVVWKKYFNLQLSVDLIHLIWHRMGYSKQTEIIKYQEFIRQMTPKSMFSDQKKLKKIKSQAALKIKIQKKIKIK